MHLYVVWGINIQTFTDAQQTLTQSSNPRRLCSLESEQFSIKMESSESHKENVSHCGCCFPVNLEPPYENYPRTFDQDM